MQSVQYRNLSDEELLRHVYIQSVEPLNPLVKELCERLSKLLDENDRLRNENFDQ